MEQTGHYGYRPYGLELQENFNKIPQNELEELLEYKSNCNGIFIDIPIYGGIYGQNGLGHLLNGDPLNIEDAKQMVNDYKLDYLVSYSRHYNKYSYNPIIEDKVLTHIKTSDGDISLIDSAVVHTSKSKKIVEKATLTGDKTSYPVIDGICKKTIKLDSKEVPIYGETKTEIFNDETNIIKTVHLKKGWSRIFSPYLSEVLVRNNDEASLIRKTVFDINEPSKRYKIFEISTNLNKNGEPYIDSVFVYLGKTATRMLMRSTAPMRTYRYNEVSIQRTELGWVITKEKCPVVQEFKIVENSGDGSYGINKNEPASDEQMVAEGSAFSESAGFRANFN